LIVFVFLLAACFAFYVLQTQENFKKKHTQLKTAEELFVVSMVKVFQALHVVKEIRTDPFRVFTFKAKQIYNNRAKKQY